VRWLALYLAGYFILLAAAVWTLWKAGVLAHIPGVWIAAAAVVAVGPAIALAAVANRTATPKIH
jgi:hypothetical protein